MWCQFGREVVMSPSKWRGTKPAYMGTSLIRNIAPIGLYSRTIPRALWWVLGGGPFLMSEVPLYSTVRKVIMAGGCRGGWRRSKRSLKRKRRKTAPRGRVSANPFV